MKRTLKLLILAAWLPAGLLLAQSTRPAKAPKPNGPVAAGGCVTADCHASVKSHKVLHGPVNVNACDACHKLVNEKEHTFEATRPKTETCTFCHQLEIPKDAVVHKPLSDGDCLGCHNPHGGTTGRFLRGQSTRELCNTCHKDVVADKKMIHGPAAAGACEACHTSHTAKFPKMLNAQGNDMCLGCHTEMKTQMAQVKFKHKAVEQECMTCHDAHASNFPMQTKTAPVELCTSCHEHEKIKKTVETATHKHSIVTQDQGCLNCHTAHGGDLAMLMKNEPIKVCMKCHDKPIEAGDIKVAAVTDVLDPKKVKHGPIRDGNCGGCHNVHGSDHVRLLSKPYSPVFYQAFALEKYDLCFSCHDKALVQTEQAKGLTGFRNGDVNLHFAHVNKADKGRNCRACHSTHASNHELHVRETVPYGKWEMPINFKKTESGGSCAPGCHKAYEYDRDKPVAYEAATPAADAKQETKP